MKYAGVCVAENNITYGNDGGAESNIDGEVARLSKAWRIQLKACAVCIDCFWLVCANDGGAESQTRTKVKVEDERESVTGQEEWGQ